MESTRPTLHRALLFSLPGAALLSLPVGAWLWDLVNVRLGFGGLFKGFPIALILLGVTILGAITVVTSYRAIARCADDIDRPFLRVCLTLFNLIAMTSGVLGFFGSLTMFTGGFD